MDSNLEAAGLSKESGAKSGISFDNLLTSGKGIKQDSVLDFSPGKSSGFEPAASLTLGRAGDSPRKAPRQTSELIPPLSLEYGRKPIEIPASSSLYEAFSGRGILKRALETKADKGHTKEKGTASEFREFPMLMGKSSNARFDVLEPSGKRKDRQPETEESAKPKDSDYWRDHWKNYWNDYWREYFKRGQRSEPASRESRGDSRTRDLLPPGWSYNDYARSDSGERASQDDRNLPPEWRGDNWRRRTGTDNRRDTTSPPSNRSDRIVPYKYGDTRIVSEPTITVQKIEEVLAKYNSPAQGLGEVIFDLGVKHNINPALALAFFVKESSAGTRGWAVRTRNWGNRKGTGPAGQAGPFMKYNSFEESLKDWFPYIHRRYVSRGLDTLPKLISVYAPNYDGNDEAGYVRSVMRMMSKWSG